MYRAYGCSYNIYSTFGVKMLELFEVFFDGEAGRDRANNDANENHDGVDGDESVRFEILRDLGNVDTVAGEVGFDETETNYDNGGGEEARDDTADFGFNEEGSANKAGVSTNQKMAMRIVLKITRTEITRKTAPRIRPPFLAMVAQELMVSISA